MKRILLFAILLILSTNALGERFTSHVRMAGVLGDGTVFIDFPISVTEGDCSHNQVRVPANSPAKKEILALALAAYTSGFELEVKTDSCLGTVPAVMTPNGWVHAIRK